MPPRFAPTRLVDYPWVVVRVDCVLCQRTGRYRLARLAARYGPEQSLAGLLADLAQDCPWWRTNPRKYEPRCGIRFLDLDHNLPPPDHPAEPFYRQRQPAREDVPKPVPSGPTLAQWKQPRLKPLLLEITCRACEYRWTERLSDLRKRFGDAAPLAEVVPALTTRCLRQQDPEIYGVCRAVLVERKGET